MGSGRYNYCQKSYQQQYDYATVRHKTYHLPESGERMVGDEGEGQRI